MCCVNLTLSVDEHLVARAREAAREQGTSLQALIRQYLERLAGCSSGGEVVRELDQLWSGGRGDSGGWKFRREQLYDQRLGRPRGSKPR